ncbi:hypothetical protein JQ633_12495 [Bradyrhizobium tropiciagri]|uniref:hypothetical protein n=1 Tax=Bradyrhizobium tropiciagri TaxID=312253 RepID=UPI001BA927CA|nr:hypothetical protein [Bradyrhizobium tropiciagri]MBR0871182.1 hypothetical protein [Bradyrhizobium tropiciagri]
MSWEAVTWASRQRMKLPHEQLILLVLANCADPSGVAFAEWPGREHWWKYLVDRTRLSKSSLFRHINTLIELGLCKRSMVVLADGQKRPTIRLDLEARYDIDEIEASHSHGRDQSHGETGDDEAVDDEDFGSEISSVDAPSVDVSRQSHGETGPTGGTGPFPIVGMHKDSILDSKTPPLPPSGGTSVPDQLWDEFVTAWGEPIPKMALARSAWDHIATVKRSEGVAAAKGYWAWLKAHPKAPSPQSAQSFLRDIAGWSQWLRYTPNASGAAVSASMAFPLASREGKALTALYEIAGKGDFLRQFMLRNGAINYPRPISPRLLALADAPQRSEWVRLERQQAAAWEGLISDAVTVQVRQRMAEGSQAPWPWPPRKDGNLSAAGPPDSLMTEQDFSDFQ